MSRSASHLPTKDFGFSLAEIAVVLVILSLLTAGAIAAFRTNVERSTRGETASVVEEAKEALLMFAAINGRLPCPAPLSDENDLSSADAGKERPQTCYDPASTARRGLIPWQTLGIRGQDAWGKVLRYDVSGVFTRPGFNLRDSEISDTNGNTPSAGQFVNLHDGMTFLNEPKRIAFAVWSAGADGIDASSYPDSQPGNGSEVYADYKCNGGAPASPSSSAGGPASSATNPGTCFQFDDMASWVSTFVLFGRLRETGKMPMVSHSTSTSSSGGP